ncbi:MAG: hypothetical protein WC795_00935 [Candidatus Paceibacterota bacterium]|jgi:hypothetical protein
MYTLSAWGEVFSASLQNLWFGFMSYVPSLIVAVIIFIIGWVISAIVGQAFESVINALKIDRLFKNTGAEETMNKMGMKFSVGGFIGGLIRWFIVIVFLMTSLEIVGLTQVNQFLREVVLGYLPQVVVASLILIVATIVADAASRMVSGSAKAANVKSANLLGVITKYAIWIFALLIALSELGIAPQFMQILFIGIVAMLALAGGLAFGLGGKDAAARTIEKIKEDIMPR